MHARIQTYRNLTVSESERMLDLSAGHKEIQPRKQYWRNKIAPSGPLLK